MGILSEKQLKIIKIDAYRCIGCSVCVQSCLNDVIRMKRSKASIVYGEDCCHCMSCEIDCPSDAIQFGRVDV